MSELLGFGDYRYEAVPDWAKLPEGWTFKEVAAVATDSQDRVYVFSRGDHPIMVFDRDGNFQKSWGEGVFKRAHGLHMAPDETLWCTDDGDHSVRRCTLDGRVLMTLGLPGSAAPYMSGKPFNRCTHTALSPQGDIYVSDGYGNAQVHKYNAQGKHLFSWGGSGTDPGQFNLTHNIVCDAAGLVYVADRESHRVQIFDGDGTYLRQWNNLHRPCSLFLGQGKCACCYVGELSPALPVNIKAPNIGPRVSVLDMDGKLLSRFGELGEGDGQFYSPHGLAVDSHGDIYVGEVSFTAWPRYHEGKPTPPGVRSLQKFACVNA